MADSLHELGGIHYNKEKYDLAIEVYKEAVEIRRQLNLKEELAEAGPPPNEEVTARLSNAVQSRREHDGAGGSPGCVGLCGVDARGTPPGGRAGAHPVRCGLEPRRVVSRRVGNEPGGAEKSGPPLAARAPLRPMH